MSHPLLPSVFVFHSVVSIPTAVYGHNHLSLFELMNSQPRHSYLHKKAIVGVEFEPGLILDFSPLYGKKNIL